MTGEAGTAVHRPGPLLSPSAIRAEFSVFRHLTYLDVASRAPMADRVSRAIDEYVRVCRAEGARKPEWFTQAELVRAETAALLRARPSEVAFMKNTSDGLNTIASALELRRGDNVIVCPEFEHANNIYPWLNLRRWGIEVRFVPMSGPAVDLSDVESLMDRRTRLVTVSAVSAMTGGVADLAGLAELCRPRGIFSLVDAAQSLGITHTDVHYLGVDALAAATQKGMLALYGLGVLYCREEWLERLQPLFLSVSAVDRNGAHESDLGELVDYAVHDTAARFETGNPNFIGLFALQAALTIVNGLGTEQIEAYVAGLAERLIAELADRSYQVVTPSERGKHAGIVAFETPNAGRVAESVEAAGVRLSIRRGRLRASLHVYNNDDDIDQLLDSLPS